MRTRSFLTVAGSCLALVIGACSSAPRSGPPAGSIAPAFTAATASGETFSLEDKRGKIILIDFFANWWGPCVASLPQLQELHNELQAMDDVEMVLVHASDNYGRYDSASALLREKDIDIPVVEKGHPIAVEYGVKYLPTMVIIDRRGAVAMVKVEDMQTPEKRRDMLRIIEDLR